MARIVVLAAELDRHAVALGVPGEHEEGGRQSVAVLEEEERDILAFRVAYISIENLLYPELAEAQVRYVVTASVTLFWKLTRTGVLRKRQHCNHQETDCGLH